MTVTLRDTFEPGLPPNDDHPYRSGVWRPQHREYDAWDMDVIGEIPEDLNGVYPVSYTHLTLPTNREV